MALRRLLPPFLSSTDNDMTDDSPDVPLKDIFDERDQPPSSPGGMDKKHMELVDSIVRKRAKKRAFLKELGLHIFLAAITLNKSVFESYVMNQALINTFVNSPIAASIDPFATTFEDIVAPGDFASWLTNVVGGTLDQTEFYNGVAMTDNQRDFVLFGNRLLGGVRLRQLRAAPNKECSLPKMLKDLAEQSDTCYSWNYSPSNTDKTPFGPPEDPTRYKYQSASQSGSSGIFGNVLEYLEGGGYVVDVNLYLKYEFHVNILLR